MLIIAIMLLLISSLRLVDEIGEPQLNPISNLQNIYIYIAILILLLVVCIVLVLISKGQVKTIVKTEVIRHEGSFISNKKDDEELQKAQKEEQEKIQKQEINETIKQLLSKLPTEESKEIYLERLLQLIARQFNIVQGLIFIRQANSDEFQMEATYAYYKEESIKNFALGEGISGQVAKNKTFLYVDNIPENYIIIRSGLGTSSPEHLLICPVVHKLETIAIIELAMFETPPDNAETIYMTLAEHLAPKLAQFVN